MSKNGRRGLSLQQLQASAMYRYRSAVQPTQMGQRRSLVLPTATLGNYRD